MYFMRIIGDLLFQFEYIKILKMNESCTIQCEALNLRNNGKNVTFIPH